MWTSPGCAIDVSKLGNRPSLQIIGRCILSGLASPNHPYEIWVAFAEVIRARFDMKLTLTEFMGKRMSKFVHLNNSNLISVS